MLRQQANPNQHHLRESPAAERNKAPILDVLRKALPPAGLVLEIASGTGQHVAHFAAGLPKLTWQPSDRDADCSNWITPHINGLNNVEKPLVLDVCKPWPIQQADAVICINMIHISPPESTLGLLSGAAAVLQPGAPLIVYGPFRRQGAHTAASNATFDAWLQEQNPLWGVRDLETVTELAASLGFTQESIHDMPANNLTVVFRRE